MELGKRRLTCAESNDRDCMAIVQFDARYMEWSWRGLYHLVSVLYLWCTEGMSVSLSQIAYR